MYDTTAIYVRVSTANGTQTTDSQLHEVKRYCAARGWTKLEIYEDRISGAKASRPELDRITCCIGLLSDINWVCRRRHNSNIKCFECWNRTHNKLGKWAVNPV